ncbi:hypothetical protein ES705_11633 [subsurface metagenome]
MKKIGVISSLLFLQSLLLHCNTTIYGQTGYRNIQVSLLTTSPGDKLHSVFGHSAVRVKNSYDNTDFVYNYGTFDFDDPSFYFGFIRGKLMYRLSKAPFDLVLQQAKLDNRSLIETTLNLSPVEKYEMTQFLEVNYLPRNRDYLYDFLYNNCSTKLLELLSVSVSDSLVYNQLAIPGMSFRKLINIYLKDKPWTDMGVDFLMGLPADRRAKGKDVSFLPDYLHLLIKNIHIKQEFGFEKSLALPDNVYFQYYPSDVKPLIHPGIILWPLTLCLLISLIFDTYIQGFFRIFRKFVLISAGSLGVLILSLWLLTDHYIFNFNTNLLWANPLLLLIVFLKESPGQMNSKKFFMLLVYGTTLLVMLGILTTMLVVRNFNLTALASMIAISLVNRIYIFRKIYKDPFYKP